MIHAVLLTQWRRIACTCTPAWSISKYSHWKKKAWKRPRIPGGELGGLSRDGRGKGVGTFAEEGVDADLLEVSMFMRWRGEMS
jgi:hypothetical protein